MFADQDPLEEDMKILVEDMTADQLVAYLRDYQIHGPNHVTLKLDGIEYRRMQWLIDVYGQPDAGRIIKWICYHHHGKADGQVITHRRFNSKMKWWVDKMHIEMQQALAKDERKAEKKSFAGFATSSDL